MSDDPAALQTVAQSLADLRALAKSVKSELAKFSF